ncbi:MAG: hypothetical protein AAF318_11250 [Pseudomonadota bacterium]
MTFLLKILALILVVAIAVPILTPQSPVGHIVSAAVDDLSGFCERKPDTCRQTAEVGRDLAKIVAATFRSLADDLSEDSLTADDRTLAPAIATHDANTVLTKQPTP